jgi:hypothetical protein
MGDLAQTLLTEKVRSLVHARKSGVLVVSNHTVSKGIFLRAGQVSFASSTLDNDKLGESLIRLGRISRVEFAAAFQANQERKRRLGQELVGAGLMTEEELGRMVAHQVQKIVLSLFTWVEGDMVFQEALDPIPADLALELSTHRLLLEGARIYPDVDRIEKSLGGPQQRMRISTHPPFDYSNITLSPVERQILNDAADELCIGDMLAHPSPRALLVRAIYALTAGGILEEVYEEVDEEVDSVSVTEPDTGTFRVAVAATEPAPVVDLRERILHLYEALPRATHYEILGLSPDADQASIATAYGRVMAEQERDWKDLRGDVRLGSVLSTLSLRRREAFRVLSEAPLRRAYDRSLGEVKPAGPLEVTAEAHHRAATLSKEALAFLEYGERDAAIPLLLAAVEADPHDAPSRRILALTLAQHRTLFRTAERHFLSALELEPADIELRYRLALYYKKAGLPKRARMQLKAVLEANPQHEGARVEMRALERAMG